MPEGHRFEPRALNSRDVVLRPNYIDPDELQKMLEQDIFFKGHFQYPTGHKGMGEGRHYDSFFLMEPIGENPRHAVTIANGVAQWIQEENIDSFNRIIAPNQPGTREIAEQLAVTILGDRDALVMIGWDSSGWFMDDVEYGLPIEIGDRVLAFNGITQAGGCVTRRFPRFVEQSGGQVVAAATFATGKAGGIEELRTTSGIPYYSAIEIGITGMEPDDCHLCEEGTIEVTPWTVLTVEK